MVDDPAILQTTFDEKAAETDNSAVADFAHAMMRKLAGSRAKGRGGWQTCPAHELWRMLREHVEKGDPVDVANLAMMIWHNWQDANNAR